MVSRRRYNAEIKKRQKIDSLRIRSLLADILLAVSVRDSGAILITKNEKDFKLIREVLDFRYLVV